jgi:flagellar motor switch protein FliM
MTPQNLLSQEEIETLLELVQSEKNAVLEGLPPGAGGTLRRGRRRKSGGGADGDDSDVQRRDFSRPGCLPRDEFEWLQGEAAHAAARAANALSTWLHLDVKVECVAIETQQYKSFLASLPSPCVVYPIACGENNALHGALSLDSSLVLAAVDRALGGRGRARFVPRMLSSIELPMALRVAKSVLRSFGEGFADVMPIAAEPSGPPGLHMRHARFLEFDTPVVIITYSIAGDLAETELRFVAPVSACQKHGVRSIVPQATGAPPAMPKIEVEVAVRLGESTMTLADLLKLEEGDVVPMEQDVGSAVEIEVEGIPVAVGRAGTIQNDFAVTIEGILQASDPAPRPEQH